MANIKELLASMIGKINGKLNAPEQAAHPHQQLVTDADGVAKWEDRLAYTEHEPVEIVPEQTVTPVSFNGGAPSAVTQVIEQFEEGATYVVTFEGKQYECVCHGVRFPLSTTPVLGVGNGSLYAVADYVDEYSNGEPFCLRNISGDSGAIDTEVNGTFTVSAVRLEETVKTIDPKYLPEIVVNVENGDDGFTIDKTFAEVEAERNAGKQIKLKAAGLCESQLPLAMYYADDNERCMIFASYFCITGYDGNVPRDTFLNVKWRVTDDNEKGTLSIIYTYVSSTVQDDTTIDLV